MALKKVVVTLRLDRQMVKTLKIQARIEKRTLSAYVRILLESLLEGNADGT